jgi:hypothetical protein
MTAVLEMKLEGIARFTGAFEPPVVVLRAVEDQRRLCLGVCEHHARAAVALVDNRGAAATPSCRASRTSRPHRVVGAHLTWLDDGPMGPQVCFTLLMERDGRTVEEPSCLFGVLKSVLRQGIAVRVDERVLAELRPSDGEPRWLAGPLGELSSTDQAGPFREFIEGLAALDRL